QVAREEGVPFLDAVDREELAETVRLSIELELTIPRALGQYADGVQRHDPAKLHVLRDGPATAHLDRLLAQQLADAPHLEDLSARWEVTEREAAPCVADRRAARAEHARRRLAEGKPPHSANAPRHGCRAGEWRGDGVVRRGIRGRGECARCGGAQRQIANADAGAVRHYHSPVTPGTPGALHLQHYPFVGRYAAEAVAAEDVRRHGPRAFRGPLSE